MCRCDPTRDASLLILVTVAFTFIFVIVVIIIFIFVILFSIIAFLFTFRTLFIRRRCTGCPTLIFLFVLVVHKALGQQLQRLLRRLTTNPIRIGDYLTGLRQNLSAGWG